MNPVSFYNTYTENIPSNLISEYINASNTEESGGSEDNLPAVINEANPVTVVNAVEDFMNLGKSDRLQSYYNLSEEEKKSFVKMLGKLLKSGYMGYEILEVNGRPEKHTIESQIGDRRLYGAKLYDEKAHTVYM